MNPSYYDGTITTNPVSSTDDYYLRVDPGNDLDVGAYTPDVEQLTEGFLHSSPNLYLKPWLTTTAHATHLLTHFHCHQRLRLASGSLSGRSDLTTPQTRTGSKSGFSKVPPIIQAHRWRQGL